ncbi:DNA repair ATPase [Aquincola sp. S2]|uniref:DNA repair ATPase n=1 Tax=Pseudaquabacterium terrae TaxID=2732868 RepID=A0ABX2EKK4_9BURK|nr:DNA repair ATPase [Aquabacterium terrae]NRF69167.1 DNA repair ATPase [Aquabacterium terrae]
MASTDGAVSADTAAAVEAPAAGDPLVAQSGSYELLKSRLATLGRTLNGKAQALNEARLAAFGRSEQALLKRTRARTDNNCVARDIVRIGELLLFGYNVFIGLRKETAVGDVFALYRLADGSGDELEPVPLAGSFLEEARFVSDFRELYAYYKQASLLQLRVTTDKLLASFQIGQQLSDVRVFRWQLERDGSVRYVDNRGERDIALPASHDFEWTPATREDHVLGKHPHVNVLDTVFVETTGGDLTVKVENNTETGLGIYSEPVDDAHQSLADAELAYARVGQLILLRMRPYRESQQRHLVYIPRTQQVQRIDAIGSACVQLPEDHGIVFPGGYVLQSGEHKRFDLPAEVVAGLRFKRMIRSPNGEDVLYVFYEPLKGLYALFSYNLIDKALAAPIVAHGYARFPDGRLLVFQDERGEPTRLHPMQLWRTPFAHDEYAQAQPPAEGFFGRIGNAELVRGISDLIGIARALAEQAPTRAAYEDLIRQAGRIADAFFWLDEPEAQGLSDDLRAVVDGARATLAEFEKVDAIRRQTAQAIEQATRSQRALLTDIASMLWRQPEDFVKALDRLREHRGALHGLKDLRYADVSAIAAMDVVLAAEQQRVGERALQFLAADNAFDGQQRGLQQLAAELAQAQSSPALAELLRKLDAQAAGLDLLTSQLGSLPGGDAVVRTRILDRISTLYADINKQRAEARQRRKALGATEARAEFGAQFKLFGQAVENALEFADSPEKCDEALTRLLAQLEELEGRFAEHDEFIADIAEQRETVYEALAARRQDLVEAQQRRAQALAEAAGRILDGVPRRVAALREPAQVHSYFAADPMLGKLRQLIDELRSLGSAVAADDIATRLKAAHDAALRAVRDQRELVADDGQTLRFGPHAFTINRQPLDLTLVPAGDGLVWQLTGTDYQAPAHDAELEALKPFWQQALLSESATLARAEYLAGTLLRELLDGRGAIDAALLQVTPEGGADPLRDAVRSAATARYQEGYQKGVHDEDATRLLRALARLQQGAGLLAYGPVARTLALRYVEQGIDAEARAALQRRARTALQLQAAFGAGAALETLQHELATALSAFNAEPGVRAEAAAYLVRQLADPRSADGWIISGRAEDLAADLKRALERSGQLAAWQHDLDAAAPAERWQLARDWVAAFAGTQGDAASAWVDEAAAALALPGARQRHNAELSATIEGLLGEHARISHGTLPLQLNDFWQRFNHHVTQVQPGFEAFRRRRHALLAAEKQRLKLSQFQAKPLSTFVRNRLIDEVYLPLVGDNLSKQLGAAGAAARSDRMGLLLLISPPGYGKTTLMEYVADRLGLVFVRINCPVLGHHVTSVDPAAAPNSAARQELEKLNLGLAMGSNVMLYLDDIQHTAPEFLQKFIALADATRRIEGVWNGEPRTYDLRGKRFAIVMAGNPYTESGEVFKIPDMLANRADIHNLGDVLSGREALFALSYIENCLTSNPVLLPLSSRDPKDLHRLVALAEGGDVASSEFAHPYSGAELDELVALLGRLARARDLLLKVNLAYIASAAQQDAYRDAPPFKLQGSYRNMVKLAGRITPLMSDSELDALLRDHYRGEAQTLTTGAEENLLRLAQLLGAPSADEAARWRAITEAFTRRRQLGGDDADGSTRIASTLLEVARAVGELKPAPAPAPDAEEPESLRLAQAVLEIAVTYRKIIMPLIAATEERLKLDHTASNQVERLAKQLDAKLARGKGSSE